MTLQTLTNIIIFSFCALFFIGGYIVTYIFARHSVWNDDKKAVVFVRTGREVKAYKGKRKDVTKQGISYIYNKKAVFVPKHYEDDYYRNMRLIFVNYPGQLIASPFNNQPLSDTEKESLIYALIESHIGADSIRALKGKSSYNIIVIAIIAFIIGALLTFGALNLQKNSAKSLSQTQTPTQTQEQLSPRIPVEVK